MSQGPCAVAALAAVVAAAETGTAIAAAIRHTASSRVRRRILVIRDTKPSVFISFLVSGQGCPGGSSEVRRPRRRGVVQATTILRVYSPHGNKPASDSSRHRTLRSTVGDVGQVLQQADSWVGVSDSARHESADVGS